MRECSAGGTAFHNTNLLRAEREAVEKGYRSRDGGIHALAATTTLAAASRFAASEDATGHAAAIAGGALLMTGAVGPYLGGLLMERLGAGSIAWFTLAAVVVATGLLIWLERVSEMRRKATQGSGCDAAPAPT